jgi:hypothetical protein
MITQYGISASFIALFFLRFLGKLDFLNNQSFSQIIPLRFYLLKIFSAKRTGPDLRREASFANKMMLLTRENMEDVLNLIGQRQADDTFKILGQ